MAKTYLLTDTYTGRNLFVTATQGKYVIRAGRYFRKTNKVTEVSSFEELPEHVRDAISLIDLSPTGNVEGVGYSMGVDLGRAVMGQLVEVVFDKEGQV